jgi:hypothetical protein
MPHSIKRRLPQLDPLEQKSINVITEIYHNNQRAGLLLETTVNLAILGPLLL